MRIENASRDTLEQPAGRYIAVPPILGTITGWLPRRPAALSCMTVLRGLALLCVLIVQAGLGAFALTVSGHDVPEHHGHDTRDGLFIDPAFTTNAASQLKRDLNFTGNISGNVYAQPLYLENGPEGKSMLIAVTESNNVYALNSMDGSVIWMRHVGQPVGTASLPCGDINPLGITGTPIVDLATRSLYFDAMTTPDNGTTKKHLVYSLNVDTGTTNAGWPVDVDARASFGGKNFTSVTQNQRSALGLLGGYVYVTYAGHAGDCSTYYGWLIGIPAGDPSSVMAWATGVRGGGSWSVGGVASDGEQPFIATGNTFNTTTWAGGEAILRFNPGPVFSGQTDDYWAPSNWQSLDSSDTDIGGSGPLIVDVPGATPSKLVAAFGKDGNVYLLDRTHLGGISAPLASAHLSSSVIIQAAATYRTAQGTYIVFCANTSQLTAIRINPANPPTITQAWTVNQNGRGSPFVTSSDGTNNVVVWGIGAESDQRLHGFDGDTGATLFNGGGAGELMAGTRRFITGIASRGRIYVAADSRVYAFGVPAGPIVLTNPVMLETGDFQFNFSNVPGMSFSILGSSNLSVALSNWSLLGQASESSPGQFQFVDFGATNKSMRYYRVRSP